MKAHLFEIVIQTRFNILIKFREEGAIILIGIALGIIEKKFTKDFTPLQIGGIVNMHNHLFIILKFQTIRFTQVIKKLRG